MTVLVDARPLVDPLNGGVTRVARGLLPALVNAMPDAHFVFATTGSHRPDLKFQASNFKLQAHLPLPNKLWSFLCVLGLTSLDRAFAKHKPDLLFLSNLGFIGKPRIPYALLVHDLSFLIEPRWFSVKARAWHRAVRAKSLIKNATHLFAVSERTKNDLITYLNIPPNRIDVIPMGLDQIPLLNEEGLGEEERGEEREALPPQLENRRFVLALGYNDPRKNARTAMQAVRLLRQDPDYADVMLVVTGARGRIQDSPLRRTGDPCDRPRSVIFLFRPSDAALATLFRHASAFLYPSWYEGFGLPLHEAARFGTPCVASTAGALPETAPQGTLFAPPFKPHLWAQTISLILDQPQTDKTQTALQDWSAAAARIRQTLSGLTHPV